MTLASSRLRAFGAGLALILLLLTCAARADAATVVSDTFDSNFVGAQPAGWTTDYPLGWSVQTAPTGLSGLALRAQAQTSFASFAQRPFARQVDPLTVTFRTRTGTSTMTGTRWGEFSVWDGATRAALVAIVDGTLRIWSGSAWTIITTAPPNTVVSVALRVDPATDRLRLTVNSVVYDNGGAGYPLEANVSGADTFKVGSYSPATGSVGEYIWLDDLVISSSPTADTSAPSAPAGLAATAGNQSVALTWSASSDNVGVTGYRVYRGGVLVGSPTGTSFSESGLTNGTSYAYTVRAIDAAGNLSASSATVNATPVAPPADTSAPSAPAGLAATAGNQSVALTWSASSDNVGVTGYRVYRGGVLVGSPTGTSFSESGLTNGTSYAYTVRAIDAAGNLSASSATVNATPVAPPADTSAPSAPAGLAATAGNQSVALTWSASSDNVGVTGYRVYRGGVLVGSPTGTSFSESGLTNGTSYAYTVRAIDAAGNLSASSATVNATPVAPVGTACPAYGPYDGLNPPGSCWMRYATTSSFNRSVPASPRLFSSNGTTSARIVSRLLSWGSAQSLVAGNTGKTDWSHPLYYSKSSDPLYTIRCTQWTSACELEGRQVRIPVAAKPAGGGDGHMTVIDQATGTEYDMWKAATPSGNGGTLNISHGGITQIDGDGLGSNATAAHFGLAAGTIRGADMQAGAIRHALFAQIKCSGGYAVAPAAAGTTAAPCATFGLSNQDAPPLGARLWLDLTGAQIDALAVPAWKKTILKAMHDYGIIVGDTNGGHQSWGIQAESEQGYASYGRSSYWRTLGAQVKAGNYGGGYVFDIQSGVDWGSHLHVLDPCVSQGAC